MIKTICSVSARSRLPAIALAFSATVLIGACGPGETADAWDAAMKQAQAAEESGDVDGAVGAYQKALAVPGIDPPRRQVAAQSAAYALQNASRHQEAAVYHRFALEALSTRRDVDTAEIVLAESNLASALNLAGKAPEAEEILLESLSRIEDETSFAYAAATVNLGNSLRLQGRLDEAESMLESGLRLLETGFGRGPAAADTLLFLANLRSERGDFAGARNHCDQALEIYRVEFGPSHYATQHSEAECVGLLNPQ